MRAVAPVAPERCQLAPSPDLIWPIGGVEMTVPGPLLSNKPGRDRRMRDLMYIHAVARLIVALTGLVTAIVTLLAILWR